MTKGHLTIHLTQADEYSAIPVNSDSRIPVSKFLVRMPDAGLVINSIRLKSYSVHSSGGTTFTGDDPSAAIRTTPIIHIRLPWLENHSQMPIAIGVNENNRTTTAGAVNAVYNGVKAMRSGLLLPVDPYTHFTHQQTDRVFNLSGRIPPVFTVDVSDFAGRPWVHFRSITLFFEFDQERLF